MFVFLRKQKTMMGRESPRVNCTKAIPTLISVAACPTVMPVMIDRDVGVNLLTEMEEDTF